MKTRYIIIVVVVVVLIIYFIFKAPKITIDSIDKATKRANLKIGNRDFIYVYDTNENMEIPLKYGFSANIEPAVNFEIKNNTNMPGSFGAVLIKTPANYATLKLYRGSSLIKTQIIDFN